MVMQFTLLAIVLAAFVLILATFQNNVSAYSGTANSGGWINSFDLNRCDFEPNGNNTYFFLQPGYQLTLEGEEDREEIRLVVSVLNQTRTIDGVQTRVVEERETADGELDEVSRNFFAVCAPDNDIFYFGEEVDMYEDGEIASHEGAWLAGEDGATAGVIVPASPKVGDRFYSEYAPNIAEDRMEVQSLTETLDTPAGRFENVLKVEETTPLEPGVKEYKMYAPGVGLIQDGPLKLVKYVLPELKGPVVPQLKSQDQSVSVEGNVIEISLNSSSTISQFRLDEENKTLSFKADAQADAEYLTKISIGKVLEGPYFVAIDRQQISDYEVTNSSDGSIISIPSEGGSHMVTITGSNVVPEFGPGALGAITAVIIAGALLAKSKLVESRLGLRIL